MTTDRWQAAPSESVFYGEVIGNPPGDDVTYVYAYSADPNASIEDLVPDGWTVDQKRIVERATGIGDQWTVQDGWTEVAGSTES